MNKIKYYIKEEEFADINGGQCFIRQTIYKTDQIGHLYTFDSRSQLWVNSFYDDLNEFKRAHKHKPDNFIKEISETEAFLEIL